MTIALPCRVRAREIVVPVEARLKVRRSITLARSLVREGSLDRVFRAADAVASPRVETQQYRPAAPGGLLKACGRLCAAPHTAKLGSCSDSVQTLSSFLAADQLGQVELVESCATRGAVLCATRLAGRAQAALGAAPVPPDPDVAAAAGSRE
jgi:hypothetical protein